MTEATAQAPLGLDQGFASQFEVYLGQVRSCVDSALDGLPENRLEARRLITRALGLDPSAEELQTVVRLAHDPVGQGPLGNISRIALASRVIAERELLELFDAEELDSSRIARSAEVIPGLLRSVTALEELIRSKAETLSETERDFLLQVGGSLVPAREPLVAAAVLFPRLQFFAEAARAEDPRSAAPSLTDGDVALLKAANRAEAGPSDRSSRTCINAVALRAIIDEDLTEWKAMQDGGKADDGNKTERTRALLRLERDRTAYRVVSERLQQQQDTALVAGLQDFAEQLRSVKQGLFSTYLRLAAVLQDPAGDAGAAGKKESKQTPAALEQLLARCSEGDSKAEATKANRVSQDELYVDALKDIREPAARPKTSPVEGADQLRRERLRLRVLTGLAGLLLLVCFTLPWMMPVAGTVDPRIAVEELPPRLTPIEAVSVGPMMYVQVSRWSWSDLDPSEQVAQVDELGAAARQRGLETVYITDEDGRDLARWTATEGVKLADPPQS
jgi:hypothetical protein